MGVAIAFVGAVTFVAHGEWLLGAGFVTVVALVLMIARLVFFRPHLVVGDDVLVLSGVFGARRVALTEVRTAVASEGSLKLKLIGGDEVYVPGHSLWGHARGDCSAYLAAVINRRLEGRASDEFE